MKAVGRLGGGERLRVFFALTLPNATVRQLVDWQERAFSDADGVRRVRLEQLHVTLAFLGSRPAAELPVLAGVLQEVASRASPISATVRLYRETRSVGMLVLSDEGGHAAFLAKDLHSRLERLGIYERERRPWLPHLTVVRFRTRPGLAPPLPDLGAFSPSGAAVYHSLLRPTGAEYEILESAALGR